MREMDDEWVRRHDMLKARNDTRPYAACMGFAGEMHGMYDRGEGGSRFYFHGHAEARARVEELEGRVARLRRRLAVYEPPPAERDPRDGESSSRWRWRRRERAPSPRPLGDLERSGGDEGG
ncbi:hypothetical protein U9M48_013574 [Paspalum notatum var. saurae]|uniref:Uncharacterized protein n=1 Tax=Paspalum notatum var. saurae TaxID=547442 RepID=A0AAQ3WJP1_PASNO